MGSHLSCEEFLPKDGCPFQKVTGVPEQLEQDLGRERAVQTLRNVVYAF